MAGNQLVVEMSADDQKLMRSIAKLEVQVEKLKGKLAQAERSGKKAGDTTRRSMQRANEDGFGKKALTQLTAYASGIFSATAAVGGLAAAWRAADQARATAARKLAQSEMGMAQLTQLAMGDPYKLQGLIHGAEQIYTGGGARSLDEAGRTMFALQSAGVGHERKLFSQLYGIVEQPDVMARAATTLHTAMGEAETGDIRAIMSKGFAASKFAPASAEQMLEATAKGADMGARLGMRDESMLAATSLLAQASGTAELGGTQLSSYLAALVKQGGFKGQTLAESVRSISDMGLADEELVKFLGRKEAMRAFSTMSLNLPELQKRTAAVTAGQEGDLLGEMIASRKQQPQLAAALLKRQAEAREEIGTTEMGVYRLLNEAADAEARARMRRNDAPEAYIQAVQGGTRFGRWLLGDDYASGPISGATPGFNEEMEAIRTATEAGTLVGEGPTEYMRRTTEAVESMAIGARGGPTLGRPEDDR